MKIRRKGCLWTALAWVLLTLPCGSLTAEAQSPSVSPMTLMQDFDAKYAVNLIKAGSLAPDFKMKTVDGKSFKLSSLRGKYVVIDFWASWCPDCRRDIPEVKRMYSTFHPRGVEFIGVSFDTAHSQWQNALRKYDMPWTQVSELVKFHDTKISKTYGVNWIPSMVLVDPEGKVVLSTVLWSKLERTLHERIAVGQKVKTTNELLSVRGSKGLLSTLVQRPAGSEDRQPVVILMHGFGGNKGGQLLTLTADSLLARGIAVVRFDFNGHGQSKGKFEEMTVPNEIEDAKCIYNYVMQQPWADTTRIALAGHSQGGVVASMTAGELGARKVAAVVLLAPAAVLRDDAIRGNTMGSVYNPLDPPATIALMGGRLKLGADYVRTAFRLPIYETAGRYQGPACIIHGTGDRVVPYTYGERYHELWKGSEYDELPGFDHGFSQDVYRVAELTALFLSKTLR